VARTFSNACADSALKNDLAFLGLTFVLFLACLSPSNAQVERVETSKRKVITIVKPDYPAIVKHANIGGSVRLSVTVLASGDVAKVETLGGNAIFVDSAAKAVIKWKYATAASQTKEEVRVEFKPN
jgi:TonB family protein